MVMKILVVTGLVVLASGFVFFAGSVIWLGLKAFFTKYSMKEKFASKHDILSGTSSEEN